MLALETIATVTEQQQTITFIASEVDDLRMSCNDFHVIQSWMESVVLIVRSQDHCCKRLDENAR